MLTFLTVVGVPITFLGCAWLWYEAAEEKGEDVVAVISACGFSVLGFILFSIPVYSWGRGSPTTDNISPLDGMVVYELLADPIPDKDRSGHSLLLIRPGVEPDAGWRHTLLYSLELNGQEVPDFFTIHRNGADELILIPVSE